MTKVKNKSSQVAGAKVEDAATRNEQKPAQNISAAQGKVQHWPFDNGNFAPLHSLRKEVDEIFNQFTNRFGAFEISAELPGVTEQDIDVSVTDSILTIHGEKQQRQESEDADHRISECSYGVYERSLSLPFNCDAKAIDANYDNGVLHLSIPKPKQVASKAQKVAIKSAA